MRQIDDDHLQSYIYVCVCDPVMAADGCMHSILLLLDLKPAFDVGSQHLVNPNEVWICGIVLQLTSYLPYRRFLHLTAMSVCFFVLFYFIFVLWNMVCLRGQFWIHSSLFLHTCFPLSSRLPLLYKKKKLNSLLSTNPTTWHNKSHHLLAPFH